MDVELPLNGSSFDPYGGHVLFVSCNGGMMEGFKEMPNIGIQWYTPLVRCRSVIDRFKSNIQYALCMAVSRLYINSELIRDSCDKSGFQLKYGTASFILFISQNGSLYYLHSVYLDSTASFCSCK